jgi:hypothetical protein
MTAGQAPGLVDNATPFPFIPDPLNVAVENRYPRVEAIGAGPI